MLTIFSNSECSRFECTEIGRNTREVRLLQPQLLRESFVRCFALTSGGDGRLATGEVGGGSN